MKPGTYTPQQWADDLSQLGHKLLLLGVADSQAIRDYTLREYPGDSVEAEERAWLLYQAFVFMAQHKQGLEHAGIIGPGADLVPASLVSALYRSLIAMPWRGRAPAPNFEAVVRMVRGEE